MKNKGFTLIEIIVVMVILGILASLTLPNLVSNINNSRAGEAKTNIDAFRTALEACIQSHPGTESTCTWSVIAPSAVNPWGWGGAWAATSTFAYVISSPLAAAYACGAYTAGPVNGNTGYNITALEYGSTAAGSPVAGPGTWCTDYMVISKASAATGAFSYGNTTCTGHGALANAC